MHPFICSILGLIGMSACLWVMDDLIRVLYVNCLARAHAITMERFTAVHAKMFAKAESYELTIETLSETAIEVIGPFLD